MELKGKLAQLILGITNLIYFLGGIGILVVGGLGLNNSSTVIDIMVHVPGIEELSKVVDLSGVAYGPAIYLTVAGSLVIVLALVGGAGLFAKHKCVISVYGITTTVMMLFNIAVLMFYAIDPYFREGTVQSYMRDVLYDNFEPISFNSTEAIVFPTNENAQAWAEMQFEQSCCGVFGSKDYAEFPWNNNITLPDGTFIVSAKVPPSCCLLIEPNQIPTSSDAFVDLQECLENSPRYTYQKPCSEYVMQQVTRYDYVYPVVAASLTGIQAFILALTMWLILIKR